MRLVFMYVGKHMAQEGSNMKWNQKAKATNYYVNFLKTEGYYYLIDNLLQEGIVDEVLVLIECVRGAGCFEYKKGFSGFVTPEMWQARKFLRKDDVIWCRGGHRTWFNFLNAAVDEGKWTICYAANTGRQKWTFWHVVFNDLDGRTWLDGRGRVQLDWKKPTNPEMFYPTEDEKVYDLCIGASHIHDKKAQWKTIDGLVEYKKIFGKNLKCVLPGSFHHGVRSSTIYDKISNNKLDVEIVGMLSRDELRVIYNKSRLFVHLGGGGQNDRGPLEAMRCGVPVVVETPGRHAPFIPQMADNWVCKGANSPRVLAGDLHYYLKMLDHDVGRRVFEFYEAEAGMDTVIMPQMHKLFGILRQHPVADIRVLREEFGI